MKHRICGDNRSEMKRYSLAVIFAFLAVTLLFSACGETDDGSPSGAVTGSAESSQRAEPDDAEDVQLAPELASIEGWFNTEPLTLASLRGQTVLVVFFSDT